MVWSSNDPDDIIRFHFRCPPLVLSSGAGAEMRQALSTAVFFGMLGVTRRSGARQPPETLAIGPTSR